MKRLILVLVAAAALLAPSAAFASGVVLKVQAASHLVAVTRTPWAWEEPPQPAAAAAQAQRTRTILTLIRC